MNLNNKMRVSFFITLSMTCFLYTAFIFNDSVSLSKALFMNRGSSLALYNIFMVETNEKSEYMSLRQLCAIESNALHNPDAALHIMSLKAKINETLLFKKYPNIKWSLMNLEETFEETPLKEWWKNDKLTRKKDYYRYSHLSDALRYVLVYKYGGFYSDLDQIALKNFQPLTRFSALVNNPTDKIDPESSFFHIKKNHEFLKLAMDDYAKNYDENQWAANGPDLLQRVMKSYCNTTLLQELLVDDRDKEFNSDASKCDIRILPFNIAYPYHWSVIQEMFEPNGKFSVSRFIRSYTVHFNSKLSRQYNVTENNSIMEFLMNYNCPIIFEKIKLLTKSS